LYRQADGARAGAGGRADAGGGLPSALRTVHEALVREYPHEWLLRWNILESLRKAGAPDDVTRPLWQELEHLEEVFQNREPIASGLRHLSDDIRSG
jgi:hypothetical protein